MKEEKFSRQGKFTKMDMFDVKLKKTINVEVELVVFQNGRYAVVGVNPETGMKMTKLITKAKAQEIKGEVIV